MSLESLYHEEISCFNCNEALGEPVLYCRTGIMIGMTYYTNIKMFYRACPKYCMQYFYKGMNLGVHVSDNKYILTFDVCLLIGSYLKQNTPVGRSAKDMIDNIDDETVKK